MIRLRKSASGAESSPEEDCQRVRREVDFIRAVISGFLGCYVCEPEILRCDQAEIARLSEKIRLDRPGKSCSLSLSLSFSLSPLFTMLLCINVLFCLLYTCVSWLFLLSGECSS